MFHSHRAASLAYGPYDGGREVALGWQETRIDCEVALITLTGGGGGCPDGRQEQAVQLFQHIGSACCVIASHMWVGEYLGWCVVL